MNAKSKLLFGFTLVLILTMAFTSMAMAAASQTGATIASDLADYNPGGTVILTGAGWANGETVHIYVNDDVGNTWNLSSNPDPVANTSGAFTYSFQLPNYFVAQYSVTATGSVSGTATSTFTDANSSANLDQCANDPAPSPSTDGCDTDSASWVNGNLGSSKAVYFEGDSIPYRMLFDSLTLSSHTVTIEWDTTKSGTHALDYIDSYNQSVLDANPCLGISGCNPGTFTTFAIPADPQVTGAGVTPIAGVFTFYGATISNVSTYSYPTGTGFTGDKSARITITFTANVVNPVLAWGGHISSRKDWGLNNSAVAISGSPYHTRLVDLDGSGGNQDRSLSADAVIFPGSITIVKDATPNGSTSFPFTASPSPLANFSLVDDGTTANTKIFSGFTNFQTYTVTEGAVTGWDLTGIVCSVTTPNGGTSSTSVATATATINMKEGENYTCTFSNKQQPANLTLVKVVTNDDGGSAQKTDFTLTATGPSTLSGAGGATGTVTPGTYTLSETTLPGYTASSWICSGGTFTAPDQIAVAAGQSATCTITNDDQAAYVKVIKTVVNDNGGSAQPDDFKLTLNGNSVLSGATTKVTPGTYTAAETQLAGYTFTGFSSDCDSSGKVTVALGETKTCILTNDDQPTYITVVKVVNNNNGGTAQPDDFKLTLNGNSVTSGVKVTVAPGTFTAGETLLPGYSFMGFSGDCDTGGSVTVALGESKTCTLTNDDMPAYVIVEKQVINNNGGSAQPNDFKLTLDGNAVNSGDKTQVKAGTHTAAETQLAGYTFVGFSGDCDSSGSVTVALGETKTCTLTNDDQQASITVVKVVNSNNGGTAQPNDFNLTLNGNSVTSGVSVPVTPGTFTAGETQLAGYTFVGFSGDCDSNGSVTVGLGESKTCTLTNDDQQAYVILNKVVVNDNGGSAQPGDFTLKLNGSPAAQATPIPVNPGTYTASETQLYGYTFTGFSGDCDTSGKVTVALGETKTCTLTNDDQPGTIVIIKNAKPVSGSFAFTTTGDGYGPFTLTPPGTVKNTQTLNAGSYTVTEGTQLGWTLTGIGGSSNPNTPYNCVVTGSGGSTGVGDLNTGTATIELKNGDTVTCTYENTGVGATRTQGFWATHPQLANIAWFGGDGFGHTFPGVAATPGIGDTQLCSVNGDIDTLGKLMGGFWSGISKKSTGKARTTLDQARMQLVQQLLAAELNASAFGSVPSGGTVMFSKWEAALCGTNVTAIKNATSQAAAFNSKGDSSTFTPGTSADSKYARSIADIPWWDIVVKP